MTSARTNWYAARLAAERKSAVEHKFHEPVGNGPLPDLVACKSCGYISCGCVWSREYFTAVDHEIIAELPERISAECAVRMTEIMIRAIQKWTPDVKVRAEPALMKHWFKEEIGS